MGSENPFTDYCNAVCARVRWPFARWRITQELTAHLEDHAAVLKARGLSPQEARVQAVAAMGDPDEVGRALNRVHSPRWGLAFTAFRLLILCLAYMIFQSTFPGLDLDTLRSCFYGSTVERVQGEQKSGFLTHISCIPLDEWRQLDSLSIHYSNAYLTLQTATADGPDPVYWLLLEASFWQRDPFRQAIDPFTGITSFSDIPLPTVFSDDLGNRYDSPFTYMLPGVDPRASEVYLDYDLFGRHYRLTIPLDWGDVS